MKLAPRDNFLHNHDNTPLSREHDHVVVDRKDWEEARILLFAERPSRQVTLSRRNLLYLLSKLETGPQGYIIKPDGTVVVTEPDGVHYAGRRPGQCSDETQAVIGQIEACLALRKALVGG